MKKIKFINKAILILLICVPFTMFAQEKIYLNEGFDKLSSSEFPPYKWRIINHKNPSQNSWILGPDGAPDALGNPTLSATSYGKFIVTNPDCWLVTPALYVENNTDSIKYWAGSLNGTPQRLRVYVSSSPKDDTTKFLARIDSLDFDGSFNSINRSISLKEFINDTIYIIFRHTNVPGVEPGIALHLDNIQGPQVVDLKSDLKISDLKGFQNPGCNVQNQKLTVVIENLGKEAVNEIIVQYQSTWYDILHLHEGEEEKDTFSTMFYDTINVTLNPGESLEHELEHEFPLAAISFGKVTGLAAYARVLINDEYELNNYIIKEFRKQESLIPPFNVGFELEPVLDMNALGWYYNKEREMVSSGSNYILNYYNNIWANTGSAFLNFVVIPGVANIPHTDGSDAFIATRCMYLEANNEYRVDFNFIFRRFPIAQNTKKLNFKLVYGKDQRNLLNDHTVLLDTNFSTTKPLVVEEEKPEYDLFSSNYFSIPEDGHYFIGMIMYSDHLVTNGDENFAVFIDDIYFLDKNSERPIDLNLNKVSVPYGCNLTKNEPISFYVKNSSTRKATNISAKYRINPGGSWVTETFDNDTIEANQQKKLTFSTLGNFETKRKYSVEVVISHVEDTILSNNELIVKTENRTVKELPYKDDFEEYGYTKIFNEEYFIIKDHDFTWFDAYDTILAKSGSQFIGDGKNYEKISGNNDYLISCCNQFKKGVTYEISFNYRILEVTLKNALIKVSLLSDYDTTAIISKLGEITPNKTSYSNQKFYFTPTEDIVGHLSLHSCGAFQSPIVLVDDILIQDSATITGVNEIEKIKVQVYPNPTNDKIFISSEESIASIFVYNTLGVNVYNSNFISDGKNYCEISLGNQPKGYYVVKIITTSGQSIIRKILVQ